MTSKKTSFQINWLQDQQFCKWLEKVPDNTNSAKCKLCLKTFSLSNMGRQAVSSHMKSTKHVKIENAAFSSAPVKIFTKSTKTTSEVPVSQNSTNNLGLTLQIHKQTTTLQKYKLKDQVTKAEILLCLNTVMQHNSLRNAERSVSLFSKMFPDSAIAQDMKLHKDKISYSIVFGLANYFKEELQTLLNANLNYVIGFDESLNKIAQKTQMDLSIRFWDENTNSIKSRYLDSVFLHQAKATNLLEAFKFGVQGFDVSRILQISMDGPNVNWSFYKLLKNDITTIHGPDTPQLLELGSCGLHVVHGAFKTGIKKTDWNIIEFLRALYNLFKMVPARRGHFTEITGVSLFPLPFCTVRWIENARVAKRSQDMLPALNTYVECVRGTDKEPSCNSFKVVQSSLKDKLLSAKLAFFQSFAEQLEPFLTEFQTDSPMVPFLYDSLSHLIKGVMSRFVKKEEMHKDNFFKINVLEKEEGFFKSLLKVKEIDLGYGTRSALRQCHGVKDKEVLMFRKDIRSCFQHFTVKIQERSPLKYPLTKALSFLNPTNISSNEETACENMTQALDIMIQSNVISPAKADKADKEYREIISKTHFKFECSNYSRKECRLDKFWMTEVKSAENIREVVQKVLLLSHGNATLERGFSINKEILVENLKEESLVAQRMIFDAVTNAGGMEEFSSQPIPIQMIHSMRNAYSRYTEAEEHRKQVI